MADKHVEILSNLIKAVSNVADRGTSSESNRDESSSASVEETIRRLFPSTEVTGSINTTSTVEARESTARRSSESSRERNENMDRQPIAIIPRFVPSNNYRPKAGKKAKSSSSKAPKKQRCDERTSVKDVNLLRGPKCAKRCCQCGTVCSGIHNNHRVLSVNDRGRDTANLTGKIAV